MGALELLNLLIGNIPAFFHWAFGLSGVVNLYALGELVYEQSIEEGRKVLGLEKD